MRDMPALTVTQNIFLGREHMRSRLGLRVLDRARMDAEARATAFSAKLVIMDEPTANLGASAIDKVRETSQRLKRDGVAVIVISHRLEDIFSVGDRMTVMKHGHVVGTRAVNDTEAGEIVHMIVTGVDPRHPETAEAEPELP